MMAQSRPEPRTFGRRKGKKLRARRQQRFQTSPFILAPSETQLDLPSLFDVEVDAYCLEIGFGAGEHLAWQAAHHPNLGFLGAEIFEAGAARMVDYIHEQNLQNVRLIVDDVRPYLRRLPRQSLQQVFLLFPDPWPKRRHSKRRFVQPATVSLIADVLKPGGEWRVATDDGSYAAWSLYHICRNPAFSWQADCAADWRLRGPDWPETRYETKARKAERPCYFMRFRREEN